MHACAHVRYAYTYEFIIRKRCAYSNLPILIFVQYNNHKETSHCASVPMSRGTKRRQFCISEERGKSKPFGYDTHSYTRTHIHNTHIKTHVSQLISHPHTIFNLRADLLHFHFTSTSMSTSPPPPSLPYISTQQEASSLQDMRISTLCRPGLS